jgi:hypothetical protein
VTVYHRPVGYSLYFVYLYAKQLTIYFTQITTYKNSARLQKSIQNNVNLQHFQASRQDRYVLLCQFPHALGVSNSHLPISSGDIPVPTLGPS